MAADPITEQMVPAGLLTGIKFDILSGCDMEKFSDTTILESSDVTDSKLGLPNVSNQCSTCGSKSIRECDGHFGIVKFPATTYHPYFIPEIVQILNQICPGCKSVKQDIRRKVASILQNNKKSISDDAYDLDAIYKSLRSAEKKLLKIIRLKLSLPKGVLSVACFKRWAKRKKRPAAVGNQAGCKYCARSPDVWYPQMKFKILPVKINGKRSFSIIAEVNERLPRRFQNRSLSDVLPKDYWNFVPEDPQQQGSLVSRMIMSPRQVFYLLKQLDPEYVKRFVSRRELLFLCCLVVTPNCHRVMEVHNYADGPRLFFDERTKAFKRLVDVSRKFDEFQHNQEFGVLASTHVTSRVLDCLNMSRLHTHQSLNEDPSCKSGLKWLKEIFLSKRTDNAFRMTVVGDPKLRLDEIGVPVDIAENMFICEHVNGYNLRKLSMVYNMQLLIKEQLYIRRKGKLISLHKANQLQVGDLVYRPLEDGDIVLINRNPSVHQHSLIAFAVKILPNKSVFSINPLCCAPFNGDFDGDCLHGFIPQSLRCRVELGQLVALDCQLLNGQDGRSLLSLTHDSLTAAHLIYNRGCVIFFSKFEMQQLAMLCPFQLPLPAILKAPGLQGPLWTGRQLFSMLLPEMTQNGNGDLYSPDQSRWPQIISAVFSRMFEYYGKKGLDFVFAAQDALCECLSMSGFSVSLSDLYLSPDSYSRTKMIDEVYSGLDEAEAASHIKKLLMDRELGVLLTSYDESEDSSGPMKFDCSTLNSLEMSQASIAAFKDVFYDLQYVVQQHISKDNSMLAMVDAGSKGSLLKLVQQGACVGLQVFPCSRDNNFDVVKASFLEGLNPLECFAHAMSSRGNMFSAHAELPGTLTRKLMFYMRDLYVCYDGTVRSAFEQQIVQFSFGIPDETPTRNDENYGTFGEEDIQNNAIGGHPVGSIAACAISEAAYGALDHPINRLESSPLMNLKKVLECGRSSVQTGSTISVILSNKLRRRAYGFEYGALEIKKHLEPVLFSDVVSTVMIVYAGRDTHFKQCSPWVLHFHVNKEKMMRKGLTLDKIINGLVGNYEIARQKTKTSLPSLCIRTEDCSLMNEEDGDDTTLYIPIAVILYEALLQFDSIRDVLIPMLLQTLIRGFVEFKRVDILWDSQLKSHDSHGELFLKVFMSENCVPGKFWSTLLDACLPIMDLIDWNRSHPDNIHDVSDMHGIDAAWKYFLGSLKSAVSDTGRKVHQEHLTIVADRLSMNGQFSGLSRKGLKLGNPTPFTQASFSNPSNSFIKAAKEGSVDHLCGTIDAMAWGKEAPIGTGGPFEILYSGEVPNVKQSENIYETLSHVQVKKSHDVKHYSKTHRFMPNNQIHMDFEFKASSVANTSFADIVDMSSSLRKILHEYPMDGYLNEVDKTCLMEALHYHPRRDEKVGTGIQDIKVGHHPSHRGTRCFILVRADGTTDDISYRKCVLGAASLISPKCADIVAQKLYHSRIIPRLEQK